MNNINIVKIIFVVLSLIFFLATFFLFYPAHNIYAILSSYNPYTSSPSISNRKNYIPGDLNGDSRVDGKDYSILIQNFGKSAKNGPSMGDFNNDNIVDNLDLKMFINYYTL
jgi:hypothetical protein